MKTVNISLTTDQYKAVEDLTQKMGYANRSELFRAIIRFVLRKPEVLSTEKFTLESFEKRPLKNIEEELRASGIYNEKFISNVVKGLRRSSLYASK